MRVADDINLEKLTTHTQRGKAATKEKEDFHRRDTEHAELFL
jgi:hypothetical protein